ncbi:MAG: hypothetical protein V4671_22280 [Armatimonadota bacterium]
MLRFGGGLLAGLGSAAESAAVATLGGPPAHVWRPLAERGLQFVLVWTVIFFLIPGKFGQEVRRGVGRLLTGGLRIVARLIACLGRELGGSRERR